MSVTDVELQVTTGGSDATTGNNQPNMPRKEM